MEVSHPRGTVLVREGDPGDSLCIIVEGVVDILKDDHVVAQLKAGDYFGELSLIDGEPRSATVVAVEDVVLLTLSSSAFDSLLSDPFFCRGILRSLSARFREVLNLQGASEI